VRAFVSVDVPPWGRRGLEGDPAPPHFTLLFLEALEESRAGPLAERIAEHVATAAPFSLAFGEVGAFPDAERPRVVFLSVREGARELSALAASVRTAADAVGVAYDTRPFVPHFTLFRVRGAADRARAARLLGHAMPEGPAAFVVERLRLKESQLTRSGAVHRVVATMPLAGVPPS